MPRVADATDPKKVKRAEAARLRRSTEAEKEKNARYRWISGIKKGTKPLVKTMKQYHVTLEEVNEIRVKAGLLPLKDDELYGYKTAKDTVEAEHRKKTVTPEQVTASVIPVARVINSIPKPPQEPTKIVEVEEEEMKTITIEDYRALYLKTGRAKGTVRDYVRDVRRILEKMEGWTPSSDIVPFLKKTKKVGAIISNLKKENGDPPASYAPFWKAISAALNDGGNGYIKPFLKRFTQSEIDYYSTSYSTTNETEEKLKSTTPNRGRIKETPQWTDVIKPLNEYIRDENTSIQNRLVASIYSGRLGGIPRANTFTKLHYVQKMADANDLTKNYIVMTSNTCTIISNTHKTGVSTESKRRKRGKALIIKLHENGNPFFTGLRQRLRQLQQDSGNRILFDVDHNYVTKVLKKATGYDNQQMRRSFETSIHRGDNIRAIALVARIHAHSIATSIKHYVDDTGRSFDTIRERFLKSSQEIDEETDEAIKEINEPEAEKPKQKIKKKKSKKSKKRR